MKLLKVVLWAAACGSLVGVSNALLEVKVFLHGQSGAEALFFPAVRFYALFWSVIALVLGLPAWAGSRLAGRRWGEGDSAPRTYLSVLLPLCLFVIVGGYVNLRWLPQVSDPRSLVFDAAFLAVCALLSVWLYRRGVRPALRMGKGLGAALGVLLLASVLWRGAGRESVASAGGPAPASSPNVIVLCVDAMRPDHLSAYGYSRRTTPNLEKLASEGVLFRNAFANSCWTRASVATIFTSMYPSSHGVNEIGSGLAESLTTLPELFREQGYATGVFSANAFVSPAFGYHQGVDRFVGQEVSIFNELILGHLARPMRKFSPVLAEAYARLEAGTFPFDSEGRVKMKAERLQGSVLKWVQGLEGRPFFAYVHYMDAHSPYELPAEFQTLFAPGRGPHETGFPLNEGFRPLVGPQKALQPGRLENLVAQYDGSIAFADRAIGGLLDRLREMGLYDRTIVVVTADHGEEMYEHEGWGHGKSLFEEVIRVPLILRAPGRLPSGTEVSQPARHVDLMPTLLDLCGIRRVPGAEGRSLVPPARGEPAAEVPVYAEVLHGNTRAETVRQGKWKLIEIRSHSEKARLLFDLEQDPMERQPLDPEGHPAGRELTALLASLREKAGRKAVRAADSQVDHAVRNKLRALGYVQ